MYTALIVGAGEGLSASLARLFARQGIKVALVARKIDKLGDLCSNSQGPHCQGGLTCDGSRCAAVCCANEDCQGEEVFEPFGDQGTLGVCRDPGACKPAGGDCSKAADCCSGDCHVGHCH